MSLRRFSDSVGPSLIAANVVLIGKCEKPGKVPTVRINEIVGMIKRSPTGAVIGNLQQSPIPVESGFVVLKVTHWRFYATRSRTARDLSAVSLGADLRCTK